MVIIMLLAIRVIVEVIDGYKMHTSVCVCARIYALETNFLVVHPHTFYNSIGQERDRFIISRLLTNRIPELYEDEPPKFFQSFDNIHLSRFYKNKTISGPNTSTTQVHVNE